MLIKPEYKTSFNLPSYQPPSVSPHPSRIVSRRKTEIIEQPNVWLNMDRFKWYATYA
jgi:hypothetical protein